MAKKNNLNKLNIELKKKYIIKKNIETKLKKINSEIKNIELKINELESFKKIETLQKYNIDIIDFSNFVEQYINTNNIDLSLKNIENKKTNIE